MKAAVLTGKDAIELRDSPIPEPGEHEVRVKVHYTGICGSDVPRVLKGAVRSYPIVLGHEFSGVVDEVGAGVDSSMVDKLVAGVPLIPCMRCPACEAGNFSLCKQYSFVGSRINGSMAEYVVLPQSNVCEVAQGVSDLAAAFFEPASVALHAIALTRVSRDSTALVLGGGTIGILLAQALSSFGVDAVVARRSPSSFPTLESAGLNRHVATGEAGWLESACEIAECDGFEYVFDAAGTPDTIRASFEAAGNKGTVVFVGTPKDDVVFSVREWECINRKELKVLGSWMSYSSPWPGGEWLLANKLFSEGVLRIAPEMIDTILPLEDIDSAFNRYRLGTVKGKVLIKMPCVKGR